LPFAAFGLLTALPALVAALAEAFALLAIVGS
jgi:hypothetical protein